MMHDCDPLIGAEILEHQVSSVCSYHVCTVPDVYIFLV